ncbi:hypothetical protein QUF72_00745 [Desulfobacterales bacterium HSG2]|nr:hypothetical protein [Desulfobacterales bacterium HSG2]
MTKFSDIQFTPRAEFSLNRLTDHEKKGVVRSLQKARSMGLTPPTASKLTGYGDIYLIRAGEELRVIFQAVKNMPTILDIVRHDKLQFISDMFKDSGMKDFQGCAFGGHRTEC